MNQELIKLTRNIRSTFLVKDHKYNLITIFPHKYSFFASRGLKHRSSIEITV